MIVTTRKPGHNARVFLRFRKIFIAQTGWGQKEHRERSKEAGFDYHLVKPIDIKALKNILLVLDKSRVLD